MMLTNPKPADAMMNPKQWLQAISITRAKTNADRLRGAAAEAIANATVPRHNAAALLSQFYRQREREKERTALRAPNLITTERSSFDT